MANAPNGFKRMFFDIETSPCLGMFWRPGYKIRLSHDNIVQESAIICICWKWEGKKKVYSLEWNKGDDKGLLERFMSEVDKADEIIAHNGDRFDEKWVRTRCLYHRIDCSPRWSTLDTLKKARSHFNFNSNRLDYLSKFMGFPGKDETTYGLWREILLNNCKKSMKDMVSYCKSDVRRLEEVYQVMQPYIKHNHHASVAVDGEKYECPNCGSDHVHIKKNRVTMAGTIKREMQCQESDCGTYYTISNKTYMALLEHRDRQKRISA